MSLLYPGQLVIIIDEEEYETPFVNTTNDAFGRRPFQLRYTTYEHAMNKLCLLLDGNRFGMCFIFQSLFSFLNVTYNIR